MLKINRKRVFSAGFALHAECSNHITRGMLGFHAVLKPVAAACWISPTLITERSRHAGFSGIFNFECARHGGFSFISLPMQLQIASARCSFQGCHRAERWHAVFLQTAHADCDCMSGFLRPRMNIATARRFAAFGVAFWFGGGLNIGV